MLNRLQKMLKKDNFGIRMFVYLLGLFIMTLGISPQIFSLLCCPQIHSSHGSSYLPLSGRFRSG